MAIAGVHGALTLRQPANVKTQTKKMYFRNTEHET
jgi:hypothetical protein